MECPPASPAANPMRDLWSTIKRGTYKNGKEYSNISGLQYFSESNVKVKIVNKINNLKTESDKMVKDAT